MVDTSSFWASWDLFRDAALAGTFAGAILGALGVYVVIRRMVFLSAALSQAASLGVAGAFWAQVQGAPPAIATPTLGALLGTLLATGLAGIPGRSSRRDGVLGAIYLVGAAGTLAIGTKIVQELQDIESLLFGSGVAVLHEDFLTIAWLALALGLVQLWLHRGLLHVSLDRDGARVQRLPVRFLNLVLVLSLATAVSVSTRLLGALPVFAFMVLPALAALDLAQNPAQALLLSALFGAAAGLGGYWLAFSANLPVGAAQTLVAALLVAVTRIAGWLLERAQALRAHQQRGPLQHEAHVHGPSCGHESIRHGDHVDYLVDGHLHHPHEGHCDDHGAQ
jgi:zinc transport system permease protein